MAIKPFDPEKHKMLLGQLEWHLDNHYYFRTNRRYKGLFGWFRAIRDRKDVNESELGAEHYWTAPFYASDENTYEILYQKYREIHENDNFSINLMRLIESKGLDHVKVYKKARLDRKLFSKIRTNQDYIPSKKTILALALAMELNLDETKKLLRDGGYALSSKVLFDVIIDFFITQKIYDFDTINAILFKYQQQIF